MKEQRSIHIVMRNFIILLTFLLTNCQITEKVELKDTLTRAEQNRSELEKVLEHYTDDTEKLKAARFLIENMYYHYSYRGEALDSMKQAKAGAIKAGRVDKTAKYKWSSVDYRQMEKVYDCQVITAEYLIKNIDLAFDTWYSRPWSKDYTFEQFCEFILPYRIEHEPLEDWREVYYNRYNPILDSLYQGTDVVEACQVVCNQLKKEGFLINMVFDLPHLGGMFLLNNRVGLCRESCDLAVYVMRALGIPLTHNYYIFSPSYWGGHNWNDLIVPNHKNIPFWYMENEVDANKSDGRKKGKVYRLCYAFQQEKYPGMYNNPKVPYTLQNPFTTDATAEHFGENQITVPIPEKGSNEFAYLGVFDKKTWVILDIAPIKKGSATFKNLEPDVFYQPLFYDYRSKRTIAAYYPFLFDGTNGHYFLPDTTQLQEVKLTRKRQPTQSILSYLLSATGTKIEGANKADFSDAQLLYEVTDTIKTNYNYIALTHKPPFRYIRYKPAPDQVAQLALLAAYNNDSLLVPEKVYGSQARKKNPESHLSHVTDNDLLTYFQSEEEGGEVILDFGKPSKIDRILYVPRNDDNFIRIGDTYELHYQGGNQEWVSLGEQTATTNCLIYKNVPKNSLLWLHNKTRGWEEQAFYYKDGKQYFPPAVKDVKIKNFL